MILVGARDAAPQPGTHQGMDVRPQGRVIEHRPGFEQAAQGDRLAEPPEAEIPPHRGGRDAGEQGAVAHAGKASRATAAMGHRLVAASTLVPPYLMSSSRLVSLL